MPATMQTDTGQEDAMPVADEVTVGARALFSDRLEIRTSEDDQEKGLIGRLVGSLAVFNEWTEIDSAVEGHFLERIAPGAFKKTFREGRDRIRCIFHHGNDPSVGVRVLGPVDVLEERTADAWAEVPLLDTSYNRDLAPGIRAGLYGMSFRFRAVRQEVNRRPKLSEHNPNGIPERTLLELRVPEFGPTPFAAYAGAVAGMRSLTDELVMGRLASDPSRLAELAKRSGISVPALWSAADTGEDLKCPDCGAMNDPDADYCDQCGAEITEEAHVSPSVTSEAHRAASRPSEVRVVTERLYARSVQFAADSVWEMQPQTLAVIFGILQERAAGVRLSPEEIQERIGTRADDPAPVEESPVRVIKLHGPIVPRADMFSEMSGSTSVERIQQQFREALANDNVQSILFDVDSPGGSSSMIPELSAEIAAARGRKPMIAVANTLMASAAYHLMSQVDRVYASPSANVGSIGVYAAHTDLTKALEAQGKKVTMVHSEGSPYKTEFQPFVELSEEAKAELQSQVDIVYDEFVNRVAAGRGTTVDNVKANYGQGRTLFAAAALEAGMIDGVETFDSVLSRMLAEATPGLTTAPAEAAPVEDHPASARRGINPKTLKPKEAPSWLL